MKGRIATGVLCASLAAMLGACSLDSSALSTGALLGGGKAKPPTPGELATERAVHVATTSSNATRCGYVFDPGQVKSSYLAFEQGQASDVAQIEKTYDFTLARLAKIAIPPADYCTDDQTAAIKRDLGKVLAGDFSTPARKNDVSNIAPKVEPLDREKIFHPIR